MPIRKENLLAANEMCCLDENDESFRFQNRGTRFWHPGVMVESDKRCHYLRRIAVLTPSTFQITGYGVTSEDSMKNLNMFLDVCGRGFMWKSIYVETEFGCFYSIWYRDLILRLIQRVWFSLIEVLKKGSVWSKGFSPVNPCSKRTNDFSLERDQYKTSAFGIGCQPHTMKKEVLKSNLRLYTESCRPRSANKEMWLRRCDTAQMCEILWDEVRFGW